MGLFPDSDAQLPSQHDEKNKIMEGGDNIKDDGAKTQSKADSNQGSCAGRTGKLACRVLNCLEWRKAKHNPRAPSVQEDFGSLSLREIAQ